MRPASDGGRGGRPGALPELGTARHHAAAGWAAAAVLIALALGGCQHRPGSEMLTTAPPQVGAGDCPVRVRNSGLRRMEVYFHTGMRSPPSDRRLWDRVGFLEPGESVRINAICDEEYIRVTAAIDQVVGFEDGWITEERRLVEGREETIRLREPRR